MLCHVQKTRLAQIYIEKQWKSNAVECKKSLCVNGP